MKKIWQILWYKYAHSSQMLTVAAVGVIAGIVLVEVAGAKFFISPLCLILALALFLYAFLKPSYAFAVLALVAGLLVGGWRNSQPLAQQADDTKDWLSVVRDDYAEKIQENIDGDKSALGLSYLLGMKEGLTKDMSDALKAVGLTHIVVASGTHLSILVDLARKIFGKLSRAAGVIFAVLLIIIFASMIGWTASITRAAVVSILGLVFGYVGRKFQPGRLIVLAMAIVLMINPANLNSLGFWLSFAAYTGIMLVAPRIKKLLYGEEKPGAVAEIIIASISATLLCLPLQLYYFGSFSLLAIPANLLILPTIPCAMGLTFLAGLKVIGRIAGWAAGMLLDYHLLVVHFLAEQEMFIMQIEQYQTWTLWLYLPIALFFILSFVPMPLHAVAFRNGIARKKIMKRRIGLRQIEDENNNEAS